MDPICKCMPSYHTAAATDDRAARTVPGDPLRLAPWPDARCSQITMETASTADTTRTAAIPVSHRRLRRCRASTNRACSAPGPGDTGLPGGGGQQPHVKPCRTRNMELL